MINSDCFLIELSLKKECIDSYKEYPFSLPAVRNLEEIQFHPAVTFIVGENGSGKSTLLEALAIAMGFNSEGGSRNFAFETKATHSVLHEYLRVTKGYKRLKNGYFLRAETFYNLATNIDDIKVVDSYGGRSLHCQSHGEGFMSLFQNRFGGQGLYIIDEPEAALSPSRQLAFISRLHDLVKEEAQFVIATHSPIIMSYPHAKVIQISEAGYSEVSFKETEHYKLSRDFLNAPERFLKHLLS